MNSLMEIKVIYETPDFLMINKPAGVLVHGIEGHASSNTLVDWLLKKYPKVKNVGDLPAGRQALPIRQGIVHRLDKDTSGVILVCLNQDFFKYAKNLFQEHKIKKKYLALVWGAVSPQKGIIKKSIRIKDGAIKRTVWRGKGEKEAITEYKVIKYFDGFTLLEVMPKTGRTHQIRVHLTSIGHPIVGDSLYGHKENPFGLKRQFLHAESLEFNLINGSRIKIEAELPDDLKNVIEKLNEEK